MAIVSKKALVSQIAKELQIGDRGALSMLNAVIGVIEDGLIEGNKVVLKGFGTFYANKRRRYRKKGTYYRVYFKPHDTFLRRLQVTNLLRHKIDEETHTSLCESLVKRLGLEE